jgi:heme exporter protein C
MGFLVPLGQGILSITPYSVKAGETQQFQIKGYNTKFASGSGMKAWLKHDDWHVPAQDITVVNPREAILRFTLPTFMDSSLANVDLALIMDTPDGPIVLPSGVNLNNLKGVQAASPDLAWSKDKISAHPETNFNYPFRSVLGETIRNTYFHVPLWFAMITLFATAVYYSIQYIRGKRAIDDQKSEAMVLVGVIFGILGTITGAIWAKFTWGSFWSFDVKQNMAAISLLIYGGYFLLKSSISDPDAKGRIGSIYNIFAFIIIIPLIFVIPRRFDSLHPGNGGNPAIGTQDLDNTMRLVFYPAVISYILLGFWIAQIVYRIKLINSRLIDNN